MLKRPLVSLRPHRFDLILPDEMTHAVLSVLLFFIVIFDFTLIPILNLFAHPSFGPLDSHNQIAGQVRSHHNVSFLAQSVAPEFEQCVVQQLHAVFLPGLD